MGINVEDYKSSDGSRRARRPEAHRRFKTKRREVKQVLKEISSTVGGGGGGGGDEEKAEVERKITELQRVVPGGESAENIDMLFEKTAGYILELQSQVKVIRVLAAFFEGLNKKKRALGG